jgi:hypothetical protein
MCSKDLFFVSIILMWDVKILSHDKSDYRQIFDRPHMCVRTHTQTSAHSHIFTCRCFAAASHTRHSFPLGPQTVPGFSYQLLTATANNNWIPAVLWLTNGAENTIPPLQRNFCFAMSWHIPLLLFMSCCLAMAGCCGHKSHFEQTCHTALSLRLLVPSSPQAYHHFLFSQGCAHDVYD